MLWKRLPMIFTWYTLGTFPNYPETLFQGIPCHFLVPAGLEYFLKTVIHMLGYNTINKNE